MTDPRKSCFTPAASEEDLFSFILSTLSRTAIEYKIDATLDVQPRPDWVQEKVALLQELNELKNPDEIYLKIYDHTGQTEKAQVLRDWIAKHQANC